MTGTLTPSQRLRRILNGQEADRPLYSAWGHFMNYADRNAKDFAKATIDFQLANGFDFIKVMSNPFYLLEDMGIVLEPVRDYASCVSRSPDILTVPVPADWEKVRFPDVHQGAIAREIEAVKRIADYFQGDVPVLPSIFTPVMWIAYASIPSPEIDRCEREYGSYVPLLERYLTGNEKYARAAAERIAEFNQEFMEELLKAGASGFFYCTDAARDLWTSRDIFEEFEKKPDVRTLNAVRGKSDFSLLHVCGESRLLFDELLEYPVDAFNWDDQMPGTPSFAELRKKTNKMLVGGLDRKTDFAGDSREQIKEIIRKRIDAALEQGGRKIMISGGCAWDFDSAYKFFIWKEVMEEYMTYPVCEGANE